MKVLVADKFETSGTEALQAAGFDVCSEPDLAGEALRDALATTGCQVLIVRSTKVTADLFEAASKLELVVRAGAGYNTIDVAAASKLGVFVSNCPGKNAVAVAELTIGLILALDRRIVENVNDLRAGKWNKKEYGQARGLKDRTLGILGMGQIGKAVARRANALEMNVVAWSRSLSEDDAEALGVSRCASLAELATESDVLSIHVAASPQTKGMVNADILNRLRPGSYVINTARADVLDYAALARVVRERDIRVGLDVYPNEPEAAQGEFLAEIVKAGGLVYGTHHVGASTQQAQDAIAAEAVRIVKSFAATGDVPNCVNIELHSPACCQLVVRHYNKVGVLASVLDHVRRAGINVEEMTNTVFQGGKASVAVFKLSQPPPPALAASLADMKDIIISVELKALKPPVKP